MLQSNILKFVALPLFLFIIKECRSQVLGSSSSQQIMEGINRQNRNAMGTPSAPTQRQIQDDLKQYHNGKPPGQTKREKQMMELKGILNEVSLINRSRVRTNYYETPKFKEDLKQYQNTLATLKQMTSGQKSASLADAIYAMESSYGQLQLSYDEYRKIIVNSAEFIKQWLKENRYSLSNSEALHFGIQKFMGETMTIKNNNIPGIGVIPNSHKPFMYDYIDYRGENDVHNYFLTKTLATGTGQCNTLPRVYLVLAEALNVEAYLTFAPQHSFIKYKNNNGTIQNYEPTVHWHMTDQDYMDEMPIIAEATRNGLYLDTLNKAQVIAVIMLDLATYFTREHWFGDGKFVDECISNAMQAYVKGKRTSDGILLKNMLLANQLEQALKKAGITDLNQINRSPEALSIYNEYRANEVLIDELGIQHFPEIKYKAMLEKHDKRGKLQAASKLDPKLKRNLFFNQ